MNNQEKFRELFLELENLTLNKNGSSFDNESFYSKLCQLRKNRVYPYYSEYEFIDFCREYRNALSHQIMENRYLDFSDECIEKLERIVEVIRHPLKALDLATTDIYSVNINYSVLDCIKEMNLNNYTYIPVYEKDKLVGIFSQEVISVLMEKCISMNENTQFKDIREYIKIENSTERLVFLNKGMNIMEAVDQFNLDLENNEKTHCVFITDNGMKDGKVLGLFTAWDILKLLRRAL